jgi:ubiquinone biosynthesis accessory factor UbiJ
VRWDLEEDLARIVGDTQAHMLAGVARQFAEALRGLASAAASRSGRAA